MKVQKTLNFSKTQKNKNQNKAQKNRKKIQAINLRKQQKKSKKQIWVSTKVCKPQMPSLMTL